MSGPVNGPVRLGFVPLSDSAPILAAQARGYFADEGLQVELSREVSWATVRDKVAVGALDASHMLAPMALAAAIGAGSEPARIIAPMALSRNAAAVTLSKRLADAVGERAGAAGLAAIVGRRREQGASPLTFAVVFPYSIHNYLLRAWMAAAGIDPDADVRLTVAPPPRMPELLAGSVIEGFCAGEPWTSIAEAEGAGAVVLRAADLWTRAPDKVLGVSEAWAEADPARLQALLRAVLRGAAWADAPGNRGELAELLARPKHVGAPAELLLRGLPHIVFHREDANEPKPQDAIWLLGQMARWRQVPRQTNQALVAARVYRPDIFRAAQAASAPHL